MTIQRTQEDILQQMALRKRADVLGWERTDLVDYLDFAHAKPFLKDGVTEEKWRENIWLSPRERMIDYMPFAWEKANGRRGISAGRSMSHFQAWLWLDGDEKIWPTLERYNFYGKPELIRICQYLKLDPSQWDDGVRVNTG